MSEPLQSDDFDDLLVGGSVLDQPIAITTFPTIHALCNTERLLTLRQLASEIRKLTAGRKEDLPWFKLARFGNERSHSGCYRTNDNLLEVSGIEADYDGGEITLEDAEFRLRGAQIAGLLYTTPNHMAEGYGPRWRVFAPFHRPHEPAARDRFMARLHGIFDGELDSASFTLSQAYYAGSITGRQPITVRLIDGRPIDTAHDLDAIARFKDDRDTGVERTCIGEQRPLGYSIGQIRYVLDCLRDDQWEGYHGGWFDIIAAVHHETSGSEDGYDLALEYSRAKPGWKPGCLTLRKWNGLGRENGRQRRRITLRRLLEWTWEERDRRECDHFINVFCDPLPEQDDFDALLDDAAFSATVDDWNGGSDEPIPSWVAKLNAKFSVVYVEGKTVILSHKADGRVAYGSATDLHTFHENDRRATKTGSEPITKTWMRHKQRASWPNGIVFLPRGGPVGAYNHWQGFSVEPDASGSCELYLAHLRDVICGRDDEAYQWLVRWFAHMIQHPEEKPGTAVVIRGRKGTGKDTVAEYVGGLFHRHHTKIGNVEHLTGRFNAHQERTLLLHVEEGFWAGNKAAEGQLKHVITSEQVQIEPKGVNAFQVPSVLRVFISSNENWVVPASFDERRFFVLNVPGKKRDNAYFTALYAEMHTGGRAALLHHLQTLDLTGFDVRNPPMTEGLRDQKLASLRGVEAWWHEALHRGVLPTGYGIEGEWASAAQNVSRDALRQEYVMWSKGRRYDGEIANEIHFGRRLREMVPALQDSRPRVAGSRVRQYVVPALDDCRAAFDAWIGGVVDWETVD